MLKEQTKTFLTAVAKGDKKTADTEFNKTTSVMDRLAAKHTLHKNTAARKRSRLASV